MDLDTYREFSTVPQWCQYPGERQEGCLFWSADRAPPAIGTPIVVTMNRCGPATVTGYFQQDGFLGVLCTLHSPPDWHRRQNNGDPSGHVFGPEFRIEETV